MKRIIYLGLPFLVLACNNSTETPSTDAGETELKTEEITEVLDVVEETDSVKVYEPLNEDGVWQIDDYAEMFVGGKIANDSKDADFKNGSGWYYSVLDKKGGYANITGALEGWKEFVIWRTAGGEDLIGKMTAGCGPACEYHFEFYLGNGKEIKEVELNTIFPIDKIKAHQKVMQEKALDKIGRENIDYPEDAQLFYRFPQKGTSMDVDLILGADEVQFPILKLKWNKTTFEIEQKINEVNEI